MIANNIHYLLLSHMNIYIFEYVFFFTLDVIIDIFI